MRIMDNNCDSDRLSADSMDGLINNYRNICFQIYGRMLENQNLL